MLDSELPRRLSGMDAFFLYAEREDQPLHVGATCIFDGRIPFLRFMRNLENRLHLIPRYRQRIVPSPLGIGHPTWEDDPGFDIKNHVFRVKVKAPGGEKELRQLSGKIFTGTLDRSKPLWEIYVVEGCEGGRGALIFKVHHCMVDGVAGIGLAFVLFDMVPDPPKSRKKPFRPEPLPEPQELLVDALWDSAIESVNHWTRFQRSVTDFGSSLNGTDLGTALRSFAASVGKLLLPLNRLPFNKPLSGRRLVCWREYSFTDTRAIRAVAGGTFNDVILTCVSGAIRRYMLDKTPNGRRIPRNIRILCPVNVRQEHERGALGNRISFLPVEVPLNIADPMERLHAIALKTSELKEAKVSGSVSLMFEALQGIPAQLQAAVLAAVANPTVQSILPTAMPPGNLICTNVPGPQIPLYVQGKRLLSTFPKVPVVMEMGVNFAIATYDQKLCINCCADGIVGNDVDKIMEYLDEGFRELMRAAEVKQADYVRIRGAADISPV
ncbi:MAG: wax ester/triacylglycerol synthase family O-acyltransferase [Candidatus Hydrogenedens sp.]|nr:wax ester/triacylglycerol synthase family O-acyltransferase [Candidatus Hydrogenedens sp.]